MASDKKPGLLLLKAAIVTARARFSASHQSSKPKPEPKRKPKLLQSRDWNWAEGDLSGGEGRMIHFSGAIRGVRV